MYVSYKRDTIYCAYIKKVPLPLKKAQKNCSLHKKPLIYLASPYSYRGPDGSIKARYEGRMYESAKYYLYSLSSDGHLVYSPIVASHHFTREIGLPTDYRSHKQLNDAFICKCDILAVAPILGYTESKGVAHEIRWANTNKIPIKLVDLAGVGEDGRVLVEYNANNRKRVGTFDPTIRVNLKVP